MAEADPAISHADATALEAATPPAPRRHWGRLAAMVSLPVLLLIGGGVYWESLQGKVTTDAMMAHLRKLQDIAMEQGQAGKSNSADFGFRVDFHALSLLRSGMQLDFLPRMNCCTKGLAEFLISSVVPTSIIFLSYIMAM